MSYLRFVAEPPPCGTLVVPISPTSRRTCPIPNFGCAQQHNLAAQIANPADLLGPRTETARDSERRDDGVRQVRQGQPTGARRAADERVNKDTSN